MTIKGAPLTLFAHGSSVDYFVSRKTLVVRISRGAPPAFRTWRNGAYGDVAQKERAGRVVSRDRVGHHVLRGPLNRSQGTDGAETGVAVRGAGTADKITLSPRRCGVEQRFCRAYLR